MGCSTCSQLWLPSDDESQHQDKEGRLQPPNITHGFQKGKTAAQPSELVTASYVQLVVTFLYLSGFLKIPFIGIIMLILL